MLFHEHAAQPAQTGVCALGRQQLIGIGTSLLRYGHGFTSPDQLAPAASKPSPAAERVLGRVPVGHAIPALHRLDSDPVADGKVFSDQNLSQWRILLKGEFVIAGNVYAQST